MTEEATLIARSQRKFRSIMERRRLSAAEIAELTTFGQKLIDDCDGAPPSYEFLYETASSVNTMWLPWDRIPACSDSWEESDVLGIWSQDRIAAIGSGIDEPTREEEEQWRRAYCRRLFDHANGLGITIVPLTPRTNLTGFALFEMPDGFPDTPPELIGMFSTCEEGMAVVERDGATSGWVEVTRDQEKLKQSVDGGSGFN